MVMRFILLLTIFTCTMSLASAQSTDRAAVLAEITDMVHERFPVSYPVLRNKLSKRVPLEQIDIPVIDYADIVEGITRQVIDYMVEHPSDFGIDEATGSSPVLRELLREKITYRHALNMLNNQSQMLLELYRKGGAISDCAAPQSVEHFNGARFAICLDSTDGSMARLKVLVEEHLSAVWELRNVDGNWSLTGIKTDMNHPLVQFLISSS